PGVQLAGAARQVPQLQGADLAAVSAGGTADRGADGRLRVALRLRLAGLRRNGVYRRFDFAVGDRPAYPVAAGPADLASDVAGADRRCRQPVHAGQAGAARRDCRLPGVVGGVVGVQAGHRQGRHGPRRFHAAGRDRRLDRLAWHPADGAAVVAGGRGDWLDLAGDEGPRPGYADSVWPVPGGGRVDRVLLGRPDGGWVHAVFGVGLRVAVPAGTACHSDLRVGATSVAIALRPACVVRSRLTSLLHGVIADWVPWHPAW